MLVGGYARYPFTRRDRIWGRSLGHGPRNPPRPAGLSGFDGVSPCAGFPTGDFHDNAAPDRAQPRCLVRLIEDQLGWPGKRSILEDSQSSAALRAELRMSNADG